MIPFQQRMLMMYLKLRATHQPSNRAPFLCDHQHGHADQNNTLHNAGFLFLLAHSSTMRCPDCFLLCVALPVVSSLSSCSSARRTASLAVAESCCSSSHTASCRINSKKTREYDYTTRAPLLHFVGLIQHDSLRTTW